MSKLTFFGSIEFGNFQKINSQNCFGSVDWYCNIVKAYSPRYITVAAI